MSAGSEPSAAARRRSRWPLYALILLGLAPVIASYLTYYYFKPEGRTNYGALIEPQIEVPALELRTLGGEPFRLADLHGQWIMLMADGGACDERCESQLHVARQVRLTAGKDQARIERVWIVTDDAPVRPALLQDYEGMHVVRGERATLERLLPVDAAGSTEITDHIYMIDPLGNLMMRFPKDVDPNRMKRDVGKLLRASAGWIMLDRDGGSPAPEAR